MELNDEEKAALIESLEAESTARSETECSLSNMVNLGLVEVFDPHPGIITFACVLRWKLTPAGQIVATLLERESRLERAKEKLKEWAKRADTTEFEWTMWSIAETNQMETPPFCIVLTWWDQEPKSWQQHHADPLTAVIEASKRTPWPVEE